ncbi:glutaredoxin-C4-like [Tribolium madens]|uniref:glutaredoxin-C4-like n=1 Tax=Tribolium madens TaxID=41895 RepID=UPI001CF73CD0|nr:glutaredoxin-C4-like [Tribolium madens]
MSSGKSKFVQNLIESDTVVIFSKSYCPYCQLTKEIFDEMDQKFTVIELDNRKDCEEIQEVLGQMTGARTVPRVFINGSFLGGASDIKKLYENGQLHNYLD